MKYLIFILALINSSFSLALQPLEKLAFPSQKFEARNGPRTNSILVWKDGKKIYEKYDRGYDENKKHILWSVSKSITSLLFAVAEHKGLASRNDSICKYDSSIPKPKCAITFKDLIFFTSGLFWIEEYEKSNRIKSASVIAMLYGEGFSDMKEFVLSHMLRRTPGLQWLYSSGDTLLLSSLLPKVFGGDRNIHKLFEEELMAPLGIEDWTLELDASGNAIGASYFHMRPRDLLKLGRLILNKGEFEGKRLFAKEWMDYVSQPSKGFVTQRVDWDKKYIGGGSFWLNRHKEAGLPKKPWLAPDDTIAAMGHWGQYLVVIPSMNLVAVRTADNRDKVYQSETFIKSLMDSL